MPWGGKMTGNKWPILVLALALLAPGACTPDKKAQEEQRQQIQGLKTEVKALQGKMAKLEASQQEILLRLQKPAAPSASAVPPPAPEPLSVSQLLREKERFLGARVTIRGMPGPVLVHRQTLLLKAPEGMVEVYFGGLSDLQTVNRLTSTTLDQPLTITGMVNLPPRGGGNLKITAEAVEF
jgi:hypothetical protein